MTYNAGGLVKKKTEKLKRSDPPNYPSIAPASKGG
jgi:hypothetical protein